MNTYPTYQQIEQATDYELLRFYRFLRSPKGPEETQILNRIIELIKKRKALRPEISRQVGWKE